MPNYLHDFEYLGAQTPGPGFYNDRFKESFQWDVEKKIIKTNYHRIEPKQWVQKHKEEQKKKGKKDNLEAINPVHQDFQTFDKTELDTKKYDKTSKNLRFFGSQDRFKDIKKSKSTTNFITPSPSNYNLMALWKGKEVKKDSNEKNKLMDY